MFSLLFLVVARGFEVSEISVYTGRGWWAPGENGAVYYRLGCGNSVASCSERTFDLRDLGVQIEQEFRVYNFGGKGWIPLDVEIDAPGVSSDSKRIVFEGCDAPDYVELAYFSTNGWELGGLSVVVDNVRFTFLPETAFPKLYSPYDDYDSIFLDLDDNFTDGIRKSDPVARLGLSRACDVTVEIETGESGVWAPGENKNLHYKLLDPKGVALTPARGPHSNQWEPPHVPLDDPLSFAVYGGLWSQSFDWMHLDDIDVETAGATSRTIDVAAWDCGGPFAKSTSLGGVELVYGNTTNGWEMTKFRARYQNASYEAVLSTEYPKVFSTYDTDSVVFFDYGGSECAANMSVCDSDWYMRFEFREAVTTCGHLYLEETWKGEIRLECTVFVHSKLTVLPGTSVILADSSLVVLPGAQLIASGTRDAPITVFGGPQVVQAAGLWQGIVLLGKATKPGISRSGYQYGDDEPDELSSSGILEHVRIYGGGGSGNDAAASLVLAGVANTPVHHVEIAYGSQDGLLIENGKVEVHHLSVFEIGDDAVDLESGCDVLLHHLFLFTDATGDHAIETDDGVVFDIRDSTIVDISFTAAALDWRGTPGPQSAMSNTFVLSKYPFAEGVHCSPVAPGNIFTTSTSCDGTVKEDATIARLSGDSVVDDEFKIDPRPKLNYGAGAFNQDPFDMWLDHWSILYELEKLDTYHDLTSTPAPPPTTTPAPSLDDAPIPKPPTPLPTTTTTTTSKKSSGAADAQGETAAVAFLTGIFVGVVAVFATLCLTRSNRFLGWPLATTTNNSNMPAQLQHPALPGGRRQYETLGVELMTSSDSGSYDEVEFT